MALRTWAKLMGTAVGVAALAGAGQLGLAYGLGIVRLTRVLDVTTRDQWTAQLAWVCWFAMTAAVVGALAARSRLPRRAGAGSRMAAAVAAAAGAAVVVPLTMQPARTAHVAGVQPVFVIGVCAGLGAAAGIFAAYAALSRSVARWSLITIGIAIWVVAIASVAPSFAPGRPLPAVRLGVVDAGLLTSSVTQRTALFTMPALALVTGVVLGWAARRRGLSTLTVALTGLAGPALLTLAYLIAGPGSGADRYQVVPYWAAMTAAGAGVLGSVLVAVLLGVPTRTGRNQGTPGSGPSTAAGPPGAGGAPLPRRDVQVDSAIAQAATAAATRSEEQLRPSDTGVFTRPAETRPASPPAERPNPQYRGAVSSNVYQSAAAPVPDGQGAMRQPAPGVAPPALATTPPMPPPAQRSRDPRKQQPDGEFVNWVNGLGNG